MTPQEFDALPNGTILRYTHVGSGNVYYYTKHEGAWYQMGVNEMADEIEDAAERGIRESAGRADKYDVQVTLPLHNISDIEKFLTEGA